MPPELHVPFVQGLDESVDPKILPSGGLTELSNARFLKDARLAPRHTYDSITGATAASYAANFGERFSVYVAPRTSVFSPATWWSREDNRNISADPMFTTAEFASCLGTLSAPRRYASARNMQGSVLACDVGYYGKYLFEVYQDADYATGTQYGCGLVVRSALSHDVILRDRLSASGRAPKVVAVGTTVMAFFADGSNVSVEIIDGDDPINSRTTTTPVVADTDKGYLYDVAPYDDTKCLLVYQRFPTQLEWGTVDLTGTFTIGGNITIAADAALAITREYNSTNVAIGYIEANVAKYNVFTIGGASIINASVGTAAYGYPVIGPHTSLGWLFAWNVKDLVVQNGINTFAPGYPVTRLLGFLSLASKPFTGPNDSCLLWTVSRMHDPSTGPATYKLIDAESIASANPTLLVKGALCEAVSCQSAALPGVFQWYGVSGAPLVDPRRFCVRAPSTLEIQDPAETTYSYSTLLPVITRLGPGEFELGTYGADLVRLDSGLFADTLLPAHINGQLLLSGARVKEFDGSRLYESGLAEGVEDFILVGNLVGSVDPGTYLYTAVFTVVDELGRRHRSAPCNPQEIILGGFVAWVSTDISYSVPAFSDHLSTNGTTCSIEVELYRTLAGGTVFYLLNQDQPLPVGGLNGVLQSYNDDVTDAILATHEVLYTQGRTGGVSGLLPNDEPPPCRVMWAGNDRVLLGGLERPSEVQWSKKLFPGEPVQFTSDSAFKANIDGDVSAVACLDGVWFAATTTAWWVISGDGPDDTGAGEFGSPRRLPSDVGCLSQRSLVEIPDGLLFQAASDRIYLMPRGGGAPVWIAQAVRTVLEEHPRIVAARLVPESNLVYFACRGDDEDVLLVYDTRNKQWSVDDTADVSCLDVFDGEIIVNSTLALGTAYATLIATTGDIRPFGLQGRGRTRKAVVLGELLATSASLTIAISYDSGQTWTESNATALTGAVGDPFYVEHLVQNVKGTNYRVRLTATGLILNALTIEYYPAAGTPRLANARRS